MQTEKRDWLIYFALAGQSSDGSNNGNGKCQVIATKQIEGFQFMKPMMHQQSYPVRMIAWNFHFLYEYPF